MRGKSPTCREAPQTLSGLRPEVYGSLDKNRFPGARAIGGSETRKGSSRSPASRRLAAHQTAEPPMGTKFANRYSLFRAGHRGLRLWHSDAKLKRLGLLFGIEEILHLTPIQME